VSDSWNAAPFAIGWTLVVAATPPNFDEWHTPNWWPADGPWSPTQPPNLTVQAGTLVEFVVEAAGVGLQGTFFGTTTEGSTEITDVTRASSLAVGQLLPSTYLPDGSRIVNIDLDAGTLTFGNGEFDEFTNSYIDPLGALVSIAWDEGGVFDAVEDRPIGTVAAVVSPGTGVTIIDVNADDGGNTSHQGDGSAICNLVGQGGGDFTVTFADAGTFTVGATFTPPSDDDNFTTTSAQPITVVVT
jgi:hypothetical protein